MDADGIVGVLRRAQAWGKCIRRGKGWSVIGRWWDWWGCIARGNGLVSAGRWQGLWERIRRRNGLAAAGRWRDWWEWRGNRGMKRGAILLLALLALVCAAAPFAGDGARGGAVWETGAHGTAAVRRGDALVGGAAWETAVTGAWAQSDGGLCGAAEIAVMAGEASGRATSADARAKEPWRYVAASMFLAAGAVFTHVAVRGGERRDRE